MTKFANNINELGWETLEQQRLIAKICTLFKAHTGGWAWKVIGDRLLKPCYMSTEYHNQKIRATKQRTDVGNSVDTTLEFSLTPFILLLQT